MKLYKKLVLSTITSLLLVSCMGNQDSENLSTKSPLLNKIQLSGYTKTDYTAKDISPNYYSSCSHSINSIINDGGIISGISCYYNSYNPYFFNGLIIIDNQEHKYISDSQSGLNIKTIKSGFDSLRIVKNNIMFGNGENYLYNYTYDFTSIQSGYQISGSSISTSPDGNIGMTLSYDSSQSLSLNQFNAYDLSGLKNVLNIKGSKNDYNYLASKVVSNKAIVNISTNPSVNKSTNGAFVYDIGARRVHSISAIDDMEKLHFDVVYQDNILIGVSQLPTKLPRLILVSTLDTMSRKYVDMPNVTETSVVKIVDYSSKVMYYTVTDNGVTNGYFYNMQNQRFYEDNDVIQILTNYTMDDSKLSTVSLSQNDKYLLLDFKYNSVNPTITPYITKIVFDDSFANFLNDKIIPINKIK
jgi:hypothetical protein